MRIRTERLVSSKKIFEESAMPWSCWVCVPAPLMPDVAFVELPPMNLKERVDSGWRCRKNKVE